YDYGYRHYAPWLARWLNPDPAGTVDGLNLYRMVRNNPVTLCDTDGRVPVFPTEAAQETAPQAEAAASSYEPEKFQLHVSRPMALAASTPFAQAIYKKVSGFDVQSYQSEKERYSSEGHFKVIEISSEKALKYGITSSDVTQALVQYVELANNIQFEFREELTSEEKKNFSISSELSAQYAGMVEEVGQIYSYVLINKRDEAMRRGGATTIYGVVSYIVEGERATLGAVVAHPLTQIPDRLRKEAGFLERLSELLTRKGGGGDPFNFQLRGVGSTLTNLSMFKMIRAHNISRFETEAINPRSGHIAHKFGMKSKAT
ncbi:RHS repeat-associated core domain-containing protein, partial [Burkholderia ubonensis]|uniref:RHS repeat-associated core domain-containing protein n=1 Tax=Burkholderia ubonensis TaxID=101571 RepID=UPI000A55DC49